MHPAGRVTLGHLLVDDAAPGGHPLHVAGIDGTAVPQAVAVLDGPREDVRDRLDAPVRVPGEAGQVVLRDVIAEVVEQEERVEVRGVPEAERAAKVHARTFAGRLGLDEPLDGPDGHLGSSSFLICLVRISPSLSRMDKAVCDRARLGGQWSVVSGQSAGQCPAAEPPADYPGARSRPGAA